MGCFVSKKRYHANRDELQAVQDELQSVQDELQAVYDNLQAVREELQSMKNEHVLQADGFRRARAQAIQDRNHLFEIKCDNATLQQQLFSTSMELVEVAKGANVPVVFSSLPLKTSLAFKATLL